MHFLFFNSSVNNEIPRLIDILIFWNSNYVEILGVIIVEHCTIWYIVKGDVVNIPDETKCGSSDEPFHVTKVLLLDERNIINCCNKSKWTRDECSETGASMTYWQYSISCHISSLKHLKRKNKYIARNQIYIILRGKMNIYSNTQMILFYSATNDLALNIINTFYVQIYFRNTLSFLSFQLDTK